jgi:hypothetical protein
MLISLCQWWIKGIKNVQLLDGKTENIPPAFTVEVIIPGAKQTLIFYAHMTATCKSWAMEPKSESLYSKLYTAAIDKRD